jgi:hypothetical protein
MAHHDLIYLVTSYQVEFHATTCKSTLTISYQTRVTHVINQQVEIYVHSIKQIDVSFITCKN